MKSLRRNHGDSATAVEQRIESVLAEVSPLLRIEHCRLELEEFASAAGRVTVRITGTCPDCAGSPAMFATAIEAHLKQRIPEVQSVLLSSRP